jgi:coenzyme F390 synthetase
LRIEVLFSGKIFPEGNIYGIIFLILHVMDTMPFFNQSVETLGRKDLDALVDERVRYTVQYANEHSPFYRAWFREHAIDPAAITSHEDLARLPVISGQTIRENQPPLSKDFLFRSAEWEEIFTVHETSGTSGIPKSFFLTWKDWERYAERYARIFISQGFDRHDRVVICASYGMNVGANTMTLAAHDIGFTVIPIGNCNFSVRVLKSYKPTGIVGSIFKLLRLARNLQEEGIVPADSSIERLVVGGESFAPESRAYLSELWGCTVFNTYGSTEGAMCGECTDLSGLHVPEDLVHLDLYDPTMKQFVPDGECGRNILTTLIPVGGTCGTLLINYDTEDTSVVLSRERCVCGRTHMKIMNPQRESETVWVHGTPLNRVDVERGVFQRENMEQLTGEYEAFLYGGEDEGETMLRVSIECLDLDSCDQREVHDRFISAFIDKKHGLQEEYQDDRFRIILNFVRPGALELYRVKGRPKRLVDRR